MPPRGERLHPVELLFCAHHFTVNRAKLRAAGATVYDLDGCPVSLTGASRPAAAPRVDANVSAPVRR